MKTKKLFSGVGILAGVLMIIAAIMIGTIPMRDIEFNAVSTEGYQFGADYYTEQYGATKNASDNVARFGNYAEKAMNAAAAAMGILMLGLGLADIAYFGMKLAAENEKTEKTAADAVQPVVQPANALTEDYTGSQTQPITDVSGEPVCSPAVTTAAEVQRNAHMEPEHIETQDSELPE